MSNVVKFPDVKQREAIRELQEEEQLVDVVLDLSLGVFSRIDLIIDGMDFQIPENHQIGKDLLLIHEAIKSCIWRMKDKEHRLQEFANQLNLEEEHEIHFTD